jgi:hypothetical protein
MHGTQTAQRGSFFETALPVAHILPIDFEGGTLAMVWVSGEGQESLAGLTHRLAAIGEQAGRLTQRALSRALGQSHPRFIHDTELFPDALLLHLVLDAPGVSRPFLKLPPLRVECLIRLDLAREETGPLLSSMAASRSFFLRFDSAPPAWVTPGEHLQAADERIDELLFSSLPVNFSAEEIALLRREFEAWRQRREAE